MAQPKFAIIPPEALDRWRPFLGDRYEEIQQTAERARHVFAGRAIWHVSSTLRGGGVAEMLQCMLPYVRGLGIDTRWVVLRESDEFFTVTKRLHNHLHGDPGDGGELGERERQVYEKALEASGRHLTKLLQAGDVVYLHDPQTAGLVPAMRQAGVRVIWRCHIGIDHPNNLAREAWEFLRRYVEEADAYIFSRREYIWDGLKEEKTWLMAPSIDPFSPKNQDIESDTVEAIVGAIGLGRHQVAHAPIFTRADGTPGRIERRAEILEEAPLPDDAAIVAQVSRWDKLKDHRGLLECFVRYVDNPAVHLVLAGPMVAAVSDDPEGKSVFEELAAAWQGTTPERRRRIHLVTLPMDDIDENAAMVNAIQRHADIIVQKSIAEGFGLTVAEGMWKQKPVVASRVGGIQDQIVDGESGVLVTDPHDLEGFASAIHGLIGDPPRAREIGQAARLRIMGGFLGIHRLNEYVDLIASLGSGGAEKQA